MDKDLILRIVENKALSSDIYQFIQDYVKQEKGVEINSKQLSEIYQLIQMRVFDLNYAIQKSCEKLNLTHLSLFDKSGKLLKISVY